MGQERENRRGVSYTLPGGQEREGEGEIEQEKSKLGSCVCTAESDGFEHLMEPFRRQIQ